MKITRSTIPCEPGYSATRYTCGDRTARVDVNCGAFGATASVEFKAGRRITGKAFAVPAQAHDAARDFVAGR